MSPIIRPPKTDLSWKRAEIIARAFHAAGKSNPWIVSGVVESYAESGWRAVIAGDHGKSFGPWQINFGYFGAAILEATNVDIRTEPDLTKHVAAVIWLLENFEVTRGSGIKAFAKVVGELNAATTGAAAVHAWTVDFEKAGANGADERRVAIAPKIEVWLANLAA